MYIYIYITCMHKNIHTCIYTNLYIHIYIYYIHIGIRLDDTKSAPYCSFINSKAKKLTKIH